MKTFDRAFFKEAFKQGYKAAKRLNEEKYDSSRDDLINKLYDLIEKDGKRMGKKSVGVRVVVDSIGKNHRYLRDFPLIYVDAPRGFNELIFKMWIHQMDSIRYNDPYYTRHVPFDDIASLEIRKDGSYKYVILTLTDSTVLYLKCDSVNYSKDQF